MKKKSQIYYESMRAVILSGIFDENEIIEILAVLLEDMKTAVWSEEREEREAQTEKEGQQ